jgi:gliding motility-associated-like protein
MLCIHPLYAQTYSPVAITGFNQDIVAEAGTNSQIVTSTSLDFAFHILYTTDFATTNAIPGGIPSNGIISSGGYNFKLEDYTLNNALYLSSGGVQPGTVASGTLTLVTPASFSKLSLLSYSTEFYSDMKVVLNYTDGTSSPVIQKRVADWFDGPAAVISGFGRVVRLAAPPYAQDGMNTNNPRFYPWDITIPCADQTKLVASITVSHISGGSTAARGVILAVAGLVNSPLSVISDVRPANCGQATGSISLSVSGGAVPFSYEWNSSPVQVTPTAVGLPAGTYTCTITDVNSCPTIVQASVTQQSTVRVKALAKPASICEGASTTLYAVPSGGRILHYTWQPGNLPDSSVRVSPADTVTYFVTGADNFGCITKDSIQINVIPTPAAPVVTSLTVCPDSTGMLVVEDADAMLVYNWYFYASGGDLAGTGSSYTTLPGTVFVEAVNGLCGGSRVAATVTSFPSVAVPVVTVQDVTVTSASFTWQPVPGATGYLVSVDGGPFVIPDSSTYYKVNGVNQSVTIRVVALGVLSCQNSLAGTATAQLKPGLVFVPNAFTPNGDGLNDIFKPEGAFRAINMKVFNQWGELISDNSVGWDGKGQPSGVYAYVMNIVLNNGEVVVRKGAVNLLR